MPHGSQLNIRTADLALRSTVVSTTRNILTEIHNEIYAPLPQKRTPPPSDRTPSAYTNCMARTETQKIRTESEQFGISALKLRNVIELPGEQVRTKRDSNSLQGTAPLRIARASIAYLCENEFGTGTYNGDQSVNLFRDGKKNWCREMADGGSVGTEMTYRGDRRSCALILGQSASHCEWVAEHVEWNGVNVPS